MTAPDAARRAALAALDRLIASAPPPTVEDAMQATRCLVALRDELVARRRAAGDPVAGDAQLARVNGVLSLVWSGAVPVIGFRADLLRKARQALEEVEA